MKIKFFAVALAAVSLGACATVTRGTTDDFTVETTPPGAQVMTTQQTEASKKANSLPEPVYYSCDSTPCTLEISRKAGFSVTVSKDGYKPQTHLVESVFSKAGGAGMAGNILIGGVIGAAIDGSTGAMNNLSPNPLVIVLEKEDGTTIVQPADVIG